MNIAVIHEDETENEFEVEICCDVCSRNNYGWSTETHIKIIAMVNKGEAIKVPSNVNSDEKFKSFVRNL